MPGLDFWKQRWEQNEIGFHEGQPNRYLVDLADRIGPPSGAVLVPFCGKSVDLVWLARAGYEVVGVEISDVAARDFFAEHGLDASRSHLDGFELYRAGGITIVVGDWYALDRNVLGTFRHVYDRAALIAVEPEGRPRYAAVMRRLCAPDARMLLVTLEHDAPGGPPFSVPRRDVEAYYAAEFEIEPLAEHDVMPTSTSLRARGATRALTRADLLRHR
jgi:thiopurine S-methyltransferase